MKSFRKVPSERAGYAPGKEVVQYHDRDAKVWFDIGDPLSPEDAAERLRRLLDGTYDLPDGWRWADADECEQIMAGDWPYGSLVVSRTFSSNGHRYTHDEADIAVPKEAS